MKAALRVNTDFTTEVLDLDTNSYDKLSSSVGGLVEPVELEDDLVLWCNEEGKIVGLTENVIGTHLWMRSYGRTDVIVGDVVFTGGTDAKTGDSLPLSHAWTVQLQELAALLRSEGTA